MGCQGQACGQTLGGGGLAGNLQSCVPASFIYVNLNSLAKPEVEKFCRFLPEECGSSGPGGEYIPCPGMPTARSRPRWIRWRRERPFCTNLIWRCRSAKILHRTPPLKSLLMFPLHESSRRLDKAGGGIMVWIPAFWRLASVLVTFGIVIHAGHRV